MYYLNYYSRLRPDVTKTVEELKKECYGKIVTKTFHSFEDIQLKEAQSHDANTVLRNAIAQELSDPILSYYQEFRIPKRSGGYRTIHAPTSELKRKQWLFSELLVDKLKILPHNAVHSYTKYRNCKTALQVHLDNHSCWFLKLDIKDFFDSITMQRWREVVENKVATIAKFKSRTSITRWETICFYMFLEDKLPQGSPASPIMSNIYLLEFDYLLTELLRNLNKHFVYTRYADDILISSREMFGWREVVRLVEELLTPYDLTLNKDKIRYGSKNGRNWNLGLMYNKDFRVTVGYRNKHKIKKDIYKFNKRTDKESEEWKKEYSRLQGVYAYYQYIEPEYFTELRKKHNEIYETTF